MNYLGMTFAWILVISGILGIILGAFWAMPKYRVYSAGLGVQQQKLVGEAELKRAQQNRLIIIEQAKAGVEAAKYDARAEVERAKGVAEANEIIAEGLGGPGGYLRYLYIQGIKEAQRDGTAQIIYIPTEAGLPILEATRTFK